jgi:hypothetical protein
MELELIRELADEHPLYGLSVRTLARRGDCDDVLFAIEDGTGRVAAVHLTWTQNPPEQPPWPGTTLFPSLDDWVIGGMLSDHDLWEQDRWPRHSTRKHRRNEEEDG